MSHLKKILMHTRNYKQLLRYRHLFDENHYRNQKCGACISNIILDYLIHFKTMKLSPTALFDCEYYISQFTDVDFAKIPPFLHYLEKGSNAPAPSAFILVDYYEEQVPKPSLRGMTHLEHYVVHGYKENVSPHPLFDPEYYVNNVVGGQITGDPLTHLLKSPFQNVVSPHPLFDVDFYCENNPDVVQAEINPFVHFVTQGYKEDRSPHPLFNVPFYRINNPDVARSKSNPLTHYVRYGAGEGRDPHLLFSTAHYKTQCPEETIKNPLIHYLAIGAKSDVSPHPVFDPRHYCGQMDGETTELPLIDYVKNNGKRYASGLPLSPHPLFDVRYYLKSNPDVARAKIEPLIHYLVQGYKENRSPHPLFSATFYVEKNPEVNNKKINPFGHYIQFGAQEGRDPHPLFSTSYYVDQNPEAMLGNPLLHYLSNSGNTNISPHPLFDASYYLEQFPEGAIDYPLVHYIMNGAGISFCDPSPFFDSTYYLSKYESVIEKGVTPLEDYILHAIKDNRNPHPLIDTHDYILQNPVLGRHNCNPLFHLMGRLQDNLPSLAAMMGRLSRPIPNIDLQPQITPFRYDTVESGGGERARVLFVTHDASRTGAPLIILKIIEAFFNSRKYEIIILADKGGELFEDFQICGYTINVNMLSESMSMDRDKTITTLTRYITKRPVHCAFINTANMLHYMEVFSNVGIPVISLIHEMATPYPPDHIERIYKSSQAVIFPSQYVYDLANEKSPIPKGKAFVLGQGLLDENFGTRIGKNEARKQLRELLRVEENAFVVLGCGSVDQRKGVDIFMATAKVFDDQHPDLPIYFVWVGDGSPQPQFPKYYFEMDIKKSRAQKILYLGPTEDTEPYFLGSDLFFLTSREDPFPCVLHEAMAAGIPTVAFRDTGGAEESLGENAGFFLDYFDLVGAVKLLESLYLQPEKVQKAGAEAAKEVRTRHNFSKYVAKIVKLAREKLAINIPAPDQAKHFEISREPIKVFFAASDWGISGVNSITMDLGTALAKKGVDARLLLTSGDEFIRCVDSLSLPMDVLPTQGMSAAEKISYFIKYLSLQAPCIVVPGYDYLLSAISPSLPNDVGIIGVVHSDDVEHYDHVDRLGRYWNKIITVSPEIGEYVKEINASFVRKLHCIQTGIEIPETMPQKRNDGILRIVYAGRMVQHQKRVLDYIEVVKNLVSRTPKVRFYFVGEGEQLGELRCALADYIDSGHVIVTGRVSRRETVEMFAHSDVFLLLSDFEGLPVTLLESMSQGCVPIAKHIRSGIHGVIDNGINGYIVPSGDLRALDNILYDLSQNENLKTMLQKNAYETLGKKKLTMRDMTNAYYEILVDVWDEIMQHTYRRPAPLIWGSPIGKISLPHFMQRID